MGAHRRVVLLAVALISLASCGSSDNSSLGSTAQRPDLHPLSASIECPGCGPYRLTICVANEGDSTADDFQIAVNSVPVAVGMALAAGEQDCIKIPYAFFSTGGALRDVVWVDSGQAVEESNEDNNILAFPKPNPTGCDEYCIETPTPMPGSSPSATATPVPIPSVRIVRVGGNIAETLPDGCAESIPGVRVEFVAEDGEIYSTISGVDGQYSLPVPLGIYRATYSHPRYEQYELMEFPVDAIELQVLHVRLTPIEPRQPFDDPNSGFAGSVSDRTGPVAGATLVFEREVDGSIRETTSGQTGRYLVLLPRGRYYISASHPEAGIQPREGFAVLCDSHVHTVNFFLYHPATPTPTPDPDNPRCGDGRVDPGEDCDNQYGFCSGYCGKRYCVDYGCEVDCTCPHIEIGGNSCCGRVFHGPGCRAEPCQTCVCASDPFCCEVEWDIPCAARAAQSCSGTCDCPGSD